jgi:DNA-3-methyladenine glycosylase II
VLEPPLDLHGSLATLGRWGDDGLDRWNGRRLLRVARLDGRAVPFRAEPGGDLSRPTVRITAPRRDLDAVAAYVSSMFVRADDALVALGTVDAAVRALDVAYPGVRPVLHHDPFLALVRSISAQQVNLAFAARIRHALALAYGTALAVSSERVHVLDAARIAQASPEDLRRLQLTYAKGRSLIAVARAAVDGELDPVELASLPDEAVTGRLVILPGIGPWSVDWFLARTLGRPRVVAGDLGVRKAVGRLYGGTGLPSEREVRDRTAHWGDAAGVVQQLALHDLAERPRAAGPP